MVGALSPERRLSPAQAEILASVIAAELRSGQAWTAPRRTSIVRIAQLIVAGSVWATVQEGRIDLRGTEDGWMRLSAYQIERLGSEGGMRCQ